MRRLLALGLMTMLAFTALGSRIGYEQRCKDLAAPIVLKMFENSPLTPGDIARLEAFDELGCSDAYLEAERQRIIRGDVEPWVEVMDR